ncbi:uncharacterized protein LOC129568037 [Sitodiplosis mosellana]|uniref:uncharacterized protein LOC129568037 n=1 Tax=Sitodiplosis mosellana TaxID=263140 RepID=UPI002444409D|nr:uncharacterized protein LOC129568037 [Sitodiplosis mosellana]
MYAQSTTWTYAILGVLGNNDGGLKYNIENIKKHEMFYWNSNEYDIALLRTFKEMEFSFWIKPVGLPPQGWSESSDGVSYQMSGWTEKEDRLLYEEATLVPCKSSLSGKVVCAKMEDAFGFDPYSARLLSSKSSASGDYLMGILSHYQNSILGNELYLDNIFHEAMISI